MMASAPPFHDLDHGSSSSSAASNHSSAGSNTLTPVSTSSPSHQRKPPALILDSSSRLLASQTAKSLPGLLAQFQTLPLPLAAVVTAPSHPSARQNCAESLLGDANVAGLAFAVDTKVRVFGRGLGVGKGELKAARVRESLKGSLDRLRVNRVRVLFAHRPDAEVPVGELAGGFGAMESDGWCEMWGVRSFPSHTLRDVLKCCERRGYKKPRVYQGEYNVLSRSIEEMLPLLRLHSMAVHAYAPTADGLLAGQSAVDSGPGIVQDTAWKGAHNSTEKHQALVKITEEGQKHGISPLSAGLRWLAYHSALGAEDGIILSASTFEDLDEKVREIAKGPLPQEMVGMIDEVGRAVGDGRARRR